MTEPTKDHGLFASLRQLLDTAVQTLQVRLALLSNELEQEKLRLFDGLLWAGLALMLLGLGALLLCAFVVVLFWDGYRLQALGLLSALLLGTGGWLLHAARKRLQTPGGLFNTSVDELGRDRAGLNTPSKFQTMSREHRDALVRRQQQLRLRSAELRVSLAHQAQVLKSPLAVADQVHGGLQWLRAHPLWPLASLALLVLKRPRRILRWAPRLLTGWQLYLRARDWLGGSAGKSARH